MNAMGKYILIILSIQIFGFTAALNGKEPERNSFLMTAFKRQEAEKQNRFSRIHLTAEVGLYANKIDEVITETFVSDLYEGSVSYIPGIINQVTGIPDNDSQSNAVLNLSLDFSLSKRFKLGIGINGIPKIQVVGYVDLDSLNQYEEYYYNKVEEIITGTTVKLQMLYVFKKYKGNGFGFEIDGGGGITYNFVNLKQNFITSVFDSTAQQWVQGEELFQNKYSSVGAYAMLRFDIYFGKNISWVNDLAIIYDTGIQIDETTYTFKQVEQSVSAHDIKLNSFMAATGLAFHF